MTPRQAKKGWRRIAHIKAQRVAIEKEMKNWSEETAKILQVASPEVRTGMIRSRQMLNIVRGEDKAVQSCKLAGQDRQVQMFEADNQVNILNHISNNCPAEWRSRYGLDGKMSSSN